MRNPRIAFNTDYVLQYPRENFDHLRSLHSTRLLSLSIRSNLLAQRSLEVKIFRYIKYNKSLGLVVVCSKPLRKFLFVNYQTYPLAQKYKNTFTLLGKTFSNGSYIIEIAYSELFVKY
jgi:hypothetical protein